MQTEELPHPLPRQTPRPQQNRRHTPQPAYYHSARPVADCRRQHRRHGYLFNDLASDYKHGIILMLAVAAFSLGYFAHLLRQYQRNRAILHALNRADAQPWKLVALWADVAWVSDKYKKITFGYTATINGVPQQITFADRPNLIRYRNKFLAIAPRHGGAPALIDDTLSTIRGLTRAERQDLIRQIQALLDAEMDEAA